MVKLDKEYIEHALENETNSQILELTSSKIKCDKNDILQKLQLPKEKLKQYHKTLQKYRYIEDPNDIILGNFIRWINLEKIEDLKLTNGGIACEFKDLNHPILLCKNSYNRFFNINLNTCLIFQRLNPQEETLLAVSNFLNK